MIKINQKNCKFASSEDCGGVMCCEVSEVCPVEAFVVKDEVIEIDQGKCIECGACVVMCQQKAVEIE